MYFARCRNRSLELELAVAGPLGGTNVNVSQGAFRLWVVFAVLWGQLCRPRHMAIDHPRVFLARLLVPDRASRAASQAAYRRLARRLRPDDPLMGFKPYKPPNLCEHEYPSVMLPDIAKVLLIVPAILLALRWAFMGFRAAKPVDGPRGERARAHSPRIREAVDHGKSESERQLMMRPFHSGLRSVRRMGE